MPQLLDYNTDHKVLTSTNTNTCVGVGPLTYASVDDLAVFICLVGSGSAVAGGVPGGWTEVTFTDNTSSQFGMYVFYRVLVGGDGAPTFTHNKNTHSMNVTLFVKDGTFDTGNIIDANSDSIFGSVSAYSSPSLTPTVNNDLLIHAIGIDNPRDPLPESNMVPLDSGEESQLSYGFGYSIAPGTAATDVVDWYGSTADDAVTCTIAIADNSASTPSNSVYIPNDNLALEFVATVVNDAVSGTGETSEDVTSTGSSDVTSIDGITTTFVEPGSGVGLLPYLNAWRSTITSGSEYRGCEIQFSSSVDMSASDYLLSLNFINISVPSQLQAAGDGGLVIVVRSSGGWKAYLMSAAEALVLNNTRKSLVLKVNDAAAFELDTNGTLATNAVLGVSVFIRRGTSNFTMEYGQLVSAGVLQIAGGWSDAPSVTSDFYKLIERAPSLIIAKQGSKQLNAIMPLSIGADGHSVYFEDSGAAINFANATDEANGIYGQHFTANTLGIEFAFYDVNSDPTINFNASSITGEFDYYVHVKDYTTTPANISADLDLLLFSGPGETEWDDLGIAHSGITFVGRDEFDYSVATMDGDFSGGCTFDNTPVTVTSEAELDKVANCTFQNAVTAITITGDQSGTWADNNLIFSNNSTADIEYTGDTNFTLESANAITVVNSGLGTLTIDAPSVSITLNSSEASTNLWVFTTATQTILASAVSNTLNYVYTGTPTFDVVAIKAGFLPQRQTGLLMDGSSPTIEFNLVADPVYDSGHGGTYPTTASWSRTNNELTVPTFGPSVRDVHSLMIESFRDEATLLNTAYNISMNGPSSMFLIEDAEGATDGDIENMTEGGVRYVDVSSAVTAEWVGVQSIGVATGFQGEYQQTAGSGTTDARATDDFNELIKTFGDSGHGSISLLTHLVLKFQPNPYFEARADVLGTYGITTLEPTLYIVPLEPDLLGVSAGDPTITMAVVDHTGAPLVVGGKSFDFELQDTGTESAEDMLRQWNYDKSLDATMFLKDPFNWTETLVEEGDNFATQYGIIEDEGTGFHGWYVSRGGLDHPEVSRFQSNDGTYYTPVVTANAQTSGIVANSRVQVYNVTAAASSAWVLNTAYSVGDRVLRTTGAGSEEVSGLFFRCSTAGTSGGTEPTWDTTVGNTTADNTVVWTTEAIAPENEKNATDWTLSYTNGEEFTAGDEVRVRVTYYDNTPDYKLPLTTTVIAGSTGFTALIAQEDWVPVNALGVDGGAVSEFTLDGGSIQIDIDDPDGETQKSRLVAWYAFSLWDNEIAIADFYGALLIEDEANYRVITSIADLTLENIGLLNVLFTDIDTRLYRDDGATLLATTGTASIEIQSDKIYVATGGGGGGDATEAKQDQIIAELGEIQGAGFDTDDNSLVAITDDMADVKSDTAATKGKTDEMIFTKANELDTNIRSVNDVGVDGSGTAGDEWRPE